MQKGSPDAIEATSSFYPNPFCETLTCSPPRIPKTLPFCELAAKIEIMVSCKAPHQRSGRRLGPPAAILTAMLRSSRGQLDLWDDFGLTTCKSPLHGICWVEVTEAEGYSRDLVCSRLPPTIPYGEPFTIGTTQNCSSLERQLETLCGPGAVVTARPATATEAYRRYPNASKDAESSCAQVQQLTSLVELGWSHYQLTDSTQQICQSCAASQAGENGCSPTYNYEELHLPPDSLARIIGDLCLVSH